VQTFLPYSRFDASAAVLDDLRLGKQRVETMQILRALVYPSYKGWKNHPATAQWRGFTDALVCYGVAMCTEWERRGRADAVRASLLEFGGGVTHDEDELAYRGRLPPWLGVPSYHASHRASLVAKLPEHYRGHFPDADPDLPYVWPEPMFRRWPVRRRRRLSVAEAADALGLGADTTDMRSQALIAVLRTPGPVLWLHDRPVEPPPPPLDRLQPPVTDRQPGKVSASVARPPTPDDVASVAAEARLPPLLHVYRVSALRDRRLRAAMPEPTLVVAEGLPDLRSVRRHFRDVELTSL
jgi:Pyrimidine dimer DNA glycosylase